MHRQSVRNLIIAAHNVYLVAEGNIKNLTALGTMLARHSRGRGRAQARYGECRFLENLLSADCSVDCAVIP